MSRKKRSDAWLHFSDTDNPNSVQCCYCKQFVSFTGGSTGNLLRHLRMKHFQTLLPRTSAAIKTSSAIRTSSATKTSSATLLSIEQCSLEDVYYSKTKSPQKGSTSIPVTLSATVSAQSSGKGLKSSATTRSKGSSTIPKRSRILQGTAQTSVPSFHAKPIPTPSSEQIDNQLLKMIVKEYNPFSIVEDVEFQILMKMLNPGYILPTRKTVSNCLSAQFYDTYNNFKETLQDVPAVALSMDGWTSTNNDSFIAVTVHYINRKTEIKANLIGCISYTEDHNSSNLAKFVKDLLMEWGLSDKVVAVVTDNDNNIVAAIKECEFTHISCFAHTLNLIIKSGLTPIQNPIEKVKSVVGHFKRSSTHLSKLSSVQDQMQLPHIKLKNDVPTRWNSTFDMITRFLQNKKPLLSVFGLLQLEFQISESEWDLLQHAADLLIVFNTVTIEISSEEKLSVSKIPILVRIMVKHVNKAMENSENPTEITEMCNILKAELSNHFLDLENEQIIDQSVFLDPRFKSKGFPDTKLEEAYSSFKNEVSSIKSQLMEKDQKTNEQTLDAEEKKDRILSPYLTDIWKDYKEITLSSPSSAAIVEIDTYFNDRHLSVKDDPLSYWADPLNQSRYPALFELVKYRLCIPATSVPCERIFSKAGNILTEKRNRLSSTKLNEILFLNQNLE